MDSTSKLRLEEWIPTEYNEKQTLRAVRKRSQIPGWREEKKNTINDFPKASATRQILKDPTRPDFQGDKQSIVTFVEGPNSPQHKDNLRQTNHQNVDLP